jgi:hypothetical protein
MNTLNHERRSSGRHPNLGPPKYRVDKLGIRNQRWIFTPTNHPRRIKMFRNCTFKELMPVSYLKGRTNYLYYLKRTTKEISWAELIQWSGVFIEKITVDHPLKKFFTFLLIRRLTIMITCARKLTIT